MTMSGASMLGSLAPLLGRIEREGYEVIAPNGGHLMSETDLADFLRWCAPIYSRRGLDVHSLSEHGAFWKGHDNYDWLQSGDDPIEETKIYHGLGKSLRVIEDATVGKQVEGVIGFSQGAVVAMVLAALRARGDDRFPHPSWAIYMAGFPPKVSAPVRVEYPIVGDFARLFVIGDHDPIFTTGRDHLETWAACFSGGTNEYHVSPCGHDVPRDDASVERMLDFIERHAPKTRGDGLDLDQD
jgi:hypothetical protein